jgi:hypothetical protein
MSAQHACRLTTMHLLQVTNTPWGERVTFAFNPKGERVQKSLHVSPFMDMGNIWWAALTLLPPLLLLLLLALAPALAILLAGDDAIE